MTTVTIDLNLVDLVEQYTQLRKVSGREYAGPCPSCGGTDRLHVVDDPAGAWWFCRQCFPADNGKRHDLPAFQVLVGDRPPAPRAPAPRRQTSTTSTTLTQGQAVELVDRAVRRLDVDDVALAYLAQRGIKASTARAWWLGSAVVWNGAERRNDPAIMLPWVMGDNVTGIKYRFLDGGRQRYTSRKVEGAGGFTDNVFGRQMYAGAYDVLLVVEGELNAVSVWQVARVLGWRHLDVISVGAQDGIRARALADIACDFRRVILWADDAKVVTSARQAAPAALALQSPNVEGVKWDANAQLVTGALDDFLITIMSKL